MITPTSAGSPRVLTKFYLRLQHHLNIGISHAGDNVEPANSAKLSARVLTVLESYRDRSSSQKLLGEYLSHVITSGSRQGKDARYVVA